MWNVVKTAGQSSFVLEPNPFSRRKQGQSELDGPWNVVCVKRITEAKELNI